MKPPLLVCARSHDEVRGAVADALTIIHAALDNRVCGDVECITRFLAADEILRRRVMERLARCPSNCEKGQGCQSASR